MLRQTETPRPRPRTSFGSVTIPGNKAGAIVSLGLAVVAWLALPVARPFILGTGGLGLIVGLFLYWKHNKNS
jgi:hypothetical protein